ncbi:uncharacterized protein LOC107367949 isoform X1 [Tetranychus urticae]|uniref:Uncharacterized protein n=1 Tax=Tetranychus urticae TaxID=32264 RepID=T1KWJ3_TETUR|nr:uncharacterized protein LOC107367949 isoform X1 [Tetranychus urticae]
MSSIPCATYSASKVHEYVRKDQKGGKKHSMKDINNSGSFTLFADTQDEPQYHYNHKLMNSIWGLYNQYAPEAFQKNQEVYMSYSSVPGMTRNLLVPGTFH